MGFSNSSMDSIARFRKTDGNASTMVHWGNVEGTGMGTGGTSTGQVTKRTDKRGKTINVPAEVSDKAVKALRKGQCMCEAMDEIAHDIPQHPLARLHWEQLQSQNPKGKKLQFPSASPSMEPKKIFEEERFAEGSGMYAYKYKYYCKKSGSEWEVL